MTTIEVRPDEATVSLSWTELTMVNNALNEVCNALDLDDFSVRMGDAREDAARLLEQVHALITRMQQT